MAGADKVFAARKKLYTQIEAMRKSRVLAYVTGDRTNLETQIHGEVIDLFADHLDELFPCKKLTLLLYTRGGSTLAAWNLVNMLRMFADEVEIIVPAKAHSAGTLMCLGADRIVMSKQATLGPIDPSVTGPLNPTIPGAPPNARAPVSVEAVKGYLEMVKSDAGVKAPEGLVSIILDLAQKVHPLVLGDIFRSRTQIQYLAKQLLANQIKDSGKHKKIIDFLCSESGSHDYTINRREASALGLNVEKATPELYSLIKQFHASIRLELGLGSPFNQLSILGGNPTANYSLTRALVESALAAHRYVSEGTLTLKQVPVGPGVMQDAVQDQRAFEGWRER